MTARHPIPFTFFHSIRASAFTLQQEIGSVEIGCPYDEKFIIFAMPFRPRTSQRGLRLNPVGRPGLTAAEAGPLARGTGATRISTSP